MKKIYLISIFTLFTLYSYSQGTDKRAKKETKLIQKYTKKFPSETELSIAIIDNGNTRYYGVKKVNDSLTYINNQNRYFEIGSLTKIFTSTLLANAVLEEKVQLDDSINSYLPIKFKDNQTITFKSLANHTSGMPRLAPNMGMLDLLNPYKKFNENDLIECLENQLRLGAKAYSYSNIGYALLGYTLTKTENDSYENLLYNKIFSKYDMTNSTTIIENTKDHLVPGLDKNGNNTPNWTLDIHVGAGGIYSTTKDLSKFAVAQFDSTNTELNLTRVKTIQVNKKIDLGLGWHFYSKKGTTYYAHDGGTGGYSSTISLDIKNNNGVIILSNVSAFNKNQKQIGFLREELLKRFK